MCSCNFELKYQLLRDIDSNQSVICLNNFSAAVALRVSFRAIFPTQSPKSTPSLPTGQLTGPSWLLLLFSLQFARKHLRAQAKPVRVFCISDIKEGGKLRVEEDKEKEEEANAKAEVEDACLRVSTPSASQNRHNWTLHDRSHYGHRRETCFCQAACVKAL